MYMMFISTYSVDVLFIDEVTQAQLSPVMTSRPTQQVQRVTPQVEATAGMYCTYHRYRYSDVKLLIVVIGSDDFSGISLSDSSTSSGGLIIHEVPSIQGTLHMCKSLILM